MTQLTEHEALTERTIADFGEQWTAYPKNDGHYASVNYFFDIVMPFLGPENIADKVVVDVGSGSGRIVLMLLAAGARHVHAVEPSAAFQVMRANTAAQADKVTGHKVRGDQIPAGLDADLAISLGVIHHIPEPDATVAAMRETLRPGGRCVLWLYGHEGNELYLAVFGPLRRVTRRIPNGVLSALSHVLTAAASAYGLAAGTLPLPLCGYFRNVFNKMDWKARYMIVFDQLNPTYAKYYRKHEAGELLERAGFEEVRIDHHHGYSWLVTGVRPSR